MADANISFTGTFSNTSPIKANTLASSAIFSTRPDPNAATLRNALRMEMDGKVVTVDYDHFMNRFVPLPPGKRRPRKTKFSAVGLQDVPLKPESAMYPALMEKLNVPWLAPGYRFVETPSKPDTKTSSKLRVDGGMYPAAEAPEEDKSTDWSTMEVFIECKTDDTKGDPFDDTAEDGRSNSSERRSVFGQLLTYSYSMFKEQHRTHLFNVIIFGSHARLSRLDRGGMVVTKKFNYKDEPEKLLEFFWRLARLSAAERGHDASAEPVVDGSEEYRLMRSRADNPRYVGDFAFQEHAREAFKESLQSSRWWKLKVDDESDPTREPKARYFLVGGPHFAASRGIAGRATRGFVAIDLGDPYGPFVYLKDAWRVAHEGIRKEGEVLGYLNREGVQNIPTRVCHGDVLPPSFQSSVSHEHWKEKYSNPEEEEVCTLKVHRHYRLVVEEVCLPMSKFQNGKELVRLIARCIAAHGNAFKKGIMHRDISAGNVLICIRESVDKNGKFLSKREGFLTDWELSKNVEEKPQENGPRQPDRTGTWQFLSANILANPTRSVELQDEMESFFHVLLYFAIRYLPTDCPDVTPLMHDYFDGYTRLGEEYSAGASKSRVMVEGDLAFAQYYLQFLTRLPVKGKPAPPPHPINRRFAKLLALFKAQYALYKLEAKAGHLGSGSDSPRPLTDGLQSYTGDTYDDDDLALISAIEGKPGFAASGDIPDPSVHAKEEHEKVAALLKSHDQMVLLLLKPFGGESNEWRRRTSYDPLKDPKKPKPSKSGKDSQEGVIPVTRMPPPSTHASTSSRKRFTLHNDDPFEDPSPKRSATGR
ncbi:hypothetical protein FKP32DRAFT_1686628, partial [Trametes sanguinea]